MVRRDSASGDIPTCGVEDPEHVCKLFARKPGGPRSDRLSSAIGPVEEGLWPQSRRVRE